MPEEYKRRRKNYKLGTTTSLQMGKIDWQIIYAKKSVLEEFWIWMFGRKPDPDINSKIIVSLPNKKFLLHKIRKKNIRYCVAHFFFLIATSECKEFIGLGGRFLIFLTFKIQITALRIWDTGGPRSLVHKQKLSVNLWTKY